MGSSQWFIIYIVLLLSSPISKFFTSGNLNGKYSKKDYNYLLKMCKEKFIESTLDDLYTLINTK